MALKIEELITLLPDAVALIPKVEAALSQFKAGPQNAETIMLFAAAILEAAAPLAGKIEAEVKD